MDYTQWARDTFKNDIYATEVTGIVIEKAADGQAVCSFEITDKHLNADGHVMGGAIFTLADLASAIAANEGELTTVSINSSISYLGVAKGKKLIAEGKTIKKGKSITTVSVDISDELGTMVAHAVFTGMKIR
ncbi:MAG: PaaI family thioesterase [Clostridia bacterium]|nr:PaaI family thioesterase [Clostridia bacterium]